MASDSDIALPLCVRGGVSLQLRSSETITEDGPDDYTASSVPALRYLHDGSTGDDTLRRKRWRRLYGAMRMSNAIYHLEPETQSGVQRDLLYILVRRVQWRLTIYTGNSGDAIDAVYWGRDERLSSIPVVSDRHRTQIVHRSIEDSLA